MIRIVSKSDTNLVAYSCTSVLFGNGLQVNKH